MKSNADWRREEARRLLNDLNDMKGAGKGPGPALREWNLRAQAFTTFAAMQLLVERGNLRGEQEP